jgi:hypothetical protein
MSIQPVETTIHLMKTETTATKYMSRMWCHTPRVGDIIELPTDDGTYQLAVVKRVQWGEWARQPRQQCVAIFVEWKK